MRPINNYDTIKANDGTFEKPSNGGYILEIVGVYDVPMDEKTGKGDYLKIEYDIADGDFRGYYQKQHERFGGKWLANFVRSYKETALGMFKHFTNCVEESNVGFRWNWEERELVGCRFGAVMQAEEYEKQNGDIGTRLVVKEVKTIAQIREGDFKVPTTKKLERTFIPVSDFDVLDDTDRPFPF